MKQAIVGTKDYHSIMQQAAKHALQRQGGYVPQQTVDTCYIVHYPSLDVKLEHLHHMVCGIQFGVESQQLIAQNPRITYLLLIESLLMVSPEGFELPLKHARMRLIALLVEICVTGLIDSMALEGLLGYLAHLTSQTPSFGLPSSLLGRPLAYPQTKGDAFTQYCNAIVDTLHDAIGEDVSYRVQFLKYWRDLEASMLYKRGWLDIDVSMTWLREQIILRLEPDKP